MSDPDYLDAYDRAMDERSDARLEAAQDAFLDWCDERGYDYSDPQARYFYGRR